MHCFVISIKLKQEVINYLKAMKINLFSKKKPKLIHLFIVKTRKSKLLVIQTDYIFLYQLVKKIWKNGT